jgi:NADPH:quinone reductase-like Zn-dependent oxidoreductase
MKAIVQDRYGGLDALEYRGIDQPVPKDNQVLVRVHAAGLDRGVWHVTAGLPYLIRFVGFGVRRPKVRVRGMDVAGTVEAVGSNVTQFQPGDEVFGWCDGSYAEYACASEDLQVLRELLEAGKVTPPISRTYPLAEVPAAIRHLVAGHGGGKIVITV